MKIDKSTMIKKDLIDILYKELQKTHLRLNKNMIHFLVDLFFNQIKESLKRDKELRIKNFGIFELKKIKERKARNPKTGETVIVKEHEKLTFKCSKNFNLVGR